MTFSTAGSTLGAAQSLAVPTLRGGPVDGRLDLGRGPVSGGVGVAHRGVARVCGNRRDSLGGALVGAAGGLAALLLQRRHAGHGNLRSGRSVYKVSSPASSLRNRRSSVQGWSPPADPPDRPDRRDSRGRGALRHPEDQPRRHRGAALPQPRAQDGHQLHRSGRGLQGMGEPGHRPEEHRQAVRRHGVPPGDQRLHDPGRRPAGHRHRQPGLPVRRRVPPRAAVRPALPAGDGQRRPGHQRIPVLHHGRARRRTSTAGTRSSARSPTARAGRSSTRSPRSAPGRWTARSRTWSSSPSWSSAGTPEAGDRTVGRRRRHPALGTGSDAGPCRLLSPPGPRGAHPLRALRAPDLP